MIPVFFVSGTPVAKGSAKGFVVKSRQTGKHRAIITQTNNERQKPWAAAIRYAAQQAMKGRSPLGGPVCIGLHFTMPRPKNHRRTGKNAHLLRDNAPVWHTSTPDMDKLVRCVWDALTGVIWHDDSQVCMMSPPPVKVYGDRPGVEITVTSL